MAVSGRVDYTLATPSAGNTPLIPPAKFRIGILRRSRITPRQSICDVGSGCPAALSHVAPQSLDTQMPLFRA